MIKKSLLVSLVAASLLGSDSSTSTMYERFNAMEKEMNALKAEIADLKAKETASSVKKVSVTDNEDNKSIPSKALSDDEDKISKISNNAAFGGLKSSKKIVVKITPRIIIIFWANCGTFLKKSCV